MAYCDSCQAASINGVPCHENGCPNIGKVWDADREQWIKYVLCHECDSEVEVGEECGNCRETSESEESDEDFERSNGPYHAAQRRKNRAGR